MVRTERNGDIYMQKILHYVKFGTYSTDTTRGERSGIRKCKSKFSVIGKFLQPDSGSWLLFFDNRLWDSCDGFHCTFKTMFLLRLA